MVKNLTEYGAFVDLGGIDGLLHVSDMSHGRVNHPSEVVHVGDEITVKVLKFDREKERISLGIAAADAGPVGDSAGALPARQPRDRPRDEHHRLRRVRRNRAGRRRLDPHFRDDLEPPHEASEQSGEGRRSGGSGGAGSETARAPRFAGHQAAGGRSVDHGRGALQHRLGGRRPGAQAGRFRRVSRNRRRRGRAGARFRSFLDQARQASLRSAEEGAGDAGGDPEHRRAQPASCRWA